MLAEVGRTTISFTSTPAGCSIAKRIARAMASGVSDCRRHPTSASAMANDAASVAAPVADDGGADARRPEGAAEEREQRLQQHTAQMAVETSAEGLEQALGALRGPTRHERIRYNTAQFSHDPKVVEHSPYGERWNDFAAAKELTEIDPGIVLVTMPGHSRGHACVAVDDGGRWLLHCGDAFDHRNEIRGLRRRVPFGMKAQAYLNAFDLGMYLDNQDRLHELWKQRDPNLMIFNAHDATLFDESKAAPVS